MYKIELATAEEVNVVERTLEEYRRIIKHHDETEEFLKGKKFKIGGYVVKKGTTYFDSVFGTSDGEIGKIVGWDFNNNYYRVYFNEEQPFQGVGEERLEKFHGNVSSKLYIKQPRDIRRIMVNLY